MHKRVLRIRAKPYWIIHVQHTYVPTYTGSNQTDIFFFPFLFSIIFSFSSFLSPFLCLLSFFAFWSFVHPPLVNWDFKLKSVVNVARVSNRINTWFVKTNDGGTHSYFWNMKTHLGIFRYSEQGKRDGNARKYEIFVPLCHDTRNYRAPWNKEYHIWHGNDNWIYDIYFYWCIFFRIIIIHNLKYQITE